MGGRIVGLRRLGERMVLNGVMQVYVVHQLFDGAVSYISVFLYELLLDFFGVVDFVEVLVSDVVDVYVQFFVALGPGRVLCWVFVAMCVFVVG